MKIALYSDLHRECATRESQLWEPPTRGYDQPGWICQACGDLHKLGQWSNSSTWHMGRCDVCGRDEVGITTPDNCGGVSRGWNRDLPSSDDYDVVVLAGDISSHTRGLSWASSAFEQPVVYVAGNHEYYDAHLGLLSELQKPEWKQAGVHFLERSTFELNGVRFLGCTLWSAFDLYGAEKADAYMTIAKFDINDYWMIGAKGGKRLEPRDTQKLHRTAVRWLDAELAKPYDGKTVVVTHFAPHRRCVAPQHQDSTVSPYFVTDLSWLMEKHRIDVWCHGHTHTNDDFIAENGCRVISNQLGYPGERTRTEFGMQIDTGFRNDLVIEL